MSHRKLYMWFALPYDTAWCSPISDNLLCPAWWHFWKSVDLRNSVRSTKNIFCICTGTVVAQTSPRTSSSLTNSQTPKGCVWWHWITLITFLPLILHQLCVDTLLTRHQSNSHSSVVMRRMDIMSLSCFHGSIDIESLDMLVLLVHIFSQRMIVLP